MKLDIKKTTLENGLRVVTIPLKSTEAITSMLLVGTGAHYEEERISGASHFLEHLVFKGSKKYPTAHEINTILDDLGAQHNAFTGEEETGFYVKTVRDKAEIALDVMADFLKNPLFDEKEIERERGVILEEVRMYYDIPQRHVVDLFTTALYGDQPAGRNTAGSEESVNAITPEDIREYFQSQYKAQSMVVVFAGNISHAEGQKLARTHFADLPKGSAVKKEPVQAPESGPDKVFLQQKDSDQTHFILGFSGIHLPDKRRHAQDVLSVILGGGMSSRLFEEIREKRGLAYYVSAGANAGTDFGYFYTRAGVNNKKFEEAVRVILAQLKDVAENVIGEKELQKAKNSIEGSTLLGIETSNAVAFAVGGQEILLDDIENPVQYVENIKNVTAQEVRNLAREIFVPEHARLAAIGPHKNPEPLEKMLSEF